MLLLTPKRLCSIVEEAAEKKKNMPGILIILGAWGCGRASLNDPWDMVDMFIKVLKEKIAPKLLVELYDEIHFLRYRRLIKEMKIIK